MPYHARRAGRIFRMRTFAGEIVAQTCGLPYRRFGIGGAPARSRALKLIGRPRNTILRYGRLRICATTMPAPVFIRRCDRAILRWNAQLSPPAAGGSIQAVQSMNGPCEGLPLREAGSGHALENALLASGHCWIHLFQKMACKTSSHNVIDPVRFESAMRRFDEANAQDPNAEVADGVTYPRELLYARRLADWVSRLCPNASEELQLAARCQHLCRWKIPRGSYPMTRTGYLQWRNDLKAFHAEKAGQILREVGYPENVISRVQDLNRKKSFPNDAESRVLEDALCLVFLQYQLAELAAKTCDDKVINALQKSWKKMTPSGREAALRLAYRPREHELLQRALQPPL